MMDQASTMNGQVLYIRQMERGLMTEKTRRNMICIVADWKVSASGSAVVRHEGGTNDGQITCGASRSVMYSEAL